MGNVLLLQILVIMAAIPIKFRSLSTKYKRVPKPFDNNKFIEAIGLLKLVSTENVYENSDESNTTYLNDVMFILLQVGDKLETSVRLLRHSFKRLDLDELQINEPVEDSFFENLNVNNDWIQTLSPAEEKRASQAIYESIKVHEFNLDGKAFMSFKSFVFAAASLKEQTNILIYKTNEFKEDGMVQNLNFYKDSLTQIDRFIDLVSKTVYDVAQKFTANKKTGLGGFEKTFCFQNIKKRKGKVFRVYENEILQHKQRPAKKVSKVKGLDSNCLWTEKKHNLKKITTTTNLLTDKKLTKKVNLNKPYLMSSMKKTIPTYFKKPIVNETKDNVKNIFKEQNMPITIETTLSGTKEE